ncbi:hypothetical protein D3C81_1814160 [compost metagenome]
MQFEGVHLHCTEQRIGLVDDHHGLACLGLVVAFNVGKVQLGGVFLEEQLTGQTVGGAYQCHGPALEVRQDPGRHVGVVLGDVALGSVGAGIDNALGMSQVQA